MGAIVGAITGSTAKKAAKKATAAAVQAQTTNNALETTAKAENTALLQPVAQQFGPATKYINQLLGTEQGGEGAAGFKTYQDNIGSDFTRNEAARGIIANRAASGGLFSGEAGKALQDRDLALKKNSLTDYLSLLGGQQAVGATGVSGQAGVNQNYVTGLTANNNSAATVTGNAALARASLNGQLTTGLIKAGAALAAGG